MSDPDVNDLLDAVGRTAVGVAIARATESARTDALFDDPFAESLVDGLRRNRRLDNLTADERITIDRAYSWVVARTVFLDRLWQQSAAAGVRQYVILGAGLDARAFRLDAPASSTIFELDRDQLFAVKEPAIGRIGATPRGRRVIVAADLTGEWAAALRDAGFDASVPTLWLAEGLLAYLQADVVAGVLAGLTELSAPGSRLGITVRGSSDGSRSQTLPAVQRLFHESGDIVGQLTGAGWRIAESSPADILADAGRAPADSPQAGARLATLLAGTLG